MPPLAVLLVTTGCQPAQSRATSIGSAGADVIQSPSPSPSTALSHVFVIVLENTSYGLALAQPYISSLASQYAVATEYHAVGLPSLPNYLAMTSGSTSGIRDDGRGRAATAEAMGE